MWIISSHTPFEASTIIIPFYRWKSGGLEVKKLAQHHTSRNHKFNQVTTLLHPKSRTLWDLQAPSSRVQAPRTCPLGGHQDTPLTSYLDQIHVSTRLSKRGMKF